jgi:hypothetical protein
LDAETAKRKTDRAAFAVGAVHDRELEHS